ncbi:MAG: hypothetical protein E6559_12195 [Pantoea sp.]|nr:hypothetical protein [Pantoea septica]MBU5378194.1 hypothetical protein [Pantoea septica]MDU5836689.1 hypothetical protein [Pantoea sp.]MDU6440650.1 hypothetical protein [Pantoea sp.]
MHLKHLAALALLFTASAAVQAQEGGAERIRERRRGEERVQEGVRRL